MILKGYETRSNIERVALFDQPKRIIFASGAIQEYLGPEAKRLRGKNIVLVADKG